MLSLSSARAGRAGVAIRVAAVAIMGPAALSSATPEPGPHGAESPGRPQCPATLAQMKGASCSAAGLACSIPYACAVTYELVECTCRASRWECKDSLGPMALDVSPRCPGRVAPSAEEAPCPSSLDSAEGRSCLKHGRWCYYAGELCSNGITMLDDCVCAGPQSALTYRCTRRPCLPAVQVEHH